MGLRFPDKKIIADIASRSAQGSRQAVADIINFPYAAFQYVTGTSSHLGEIASLSRFGSQYDLDHLLEDNFFTRTADVANHVVYGTFDFVLGHLPYQAMAAVGLEDHMPYFRPPPTTAEGRAHELCNAVFLGLTPGAIRGVRSRLGLPKKSSSLAAQAAAVQRASSFIFRARSVAATAVLRAAVSTVARGFRDRVALVHSQIKTRWLKAPAWLRSVASERGMIAVPRVFGADSTLLGDAGVVMRKAYRKKTSLEPKVGGGMTPASEGAPPNLDPVAMRARIDRLDRPSCDYLNINVASAVLKELMMMAEELAVPEIHRVMNLFDILGLFDRMMEIAAKMPIAWKAQIKLAGPMGQVGFKARAAAIINGHRAKALVALQKAASEALGDPGRNLILREMVDLGFYKEVVQLLGSYEARHASRYPQGFSTLVSGLIPLLEKLPQQEIGPFFRVLMAHTRTIGDIVTRRSNFYQIANLYDGLGQLSLAQAAAEAAVQTIYEQGGFTVQSPVFSPIIKDHFLGLVVNATGRPKAYYLEATAAYARGLADLNQQCWILKNLAQVAGDAAAGLFDETIAVATRLPIVDRIRLITGENGVVEKLIAKGFYRKAGRTLEDLRADIDWGLSGWGKENALVGVRRSEKLLKQVELSLDK